MLVSYRWLRELLPELDRDPSEVAEVLSAVGLAVDAVSHFSRSLSGVLIATVLEVEPHPSRDQLRLVTVRTRGEETSSLGADSFRPPEIAGPPPAEVTVVCGANNVPEPGGQVVFAPLGTKLPGVDFVLEPRSIGGVESQGMLCSETELGLAETSEGIMTFALDSYPVGQSLIDAIPEAGDTIFDVDVTPNRPDALGHVGVARDLAAVFELSFTVPGPGKIGSEGPPAERDIAVENHDVDRCPRYGAAVVRGIELGPSPEWMRWRLHRLGVRPISNAVDITNWLLLEFGQPLHAFDLAKVRKRQIVVRRAEDGETMHTLDGEERELVADDLLICDGKGPTALAGIMGGADSEIADSTRDVLIECAHFEPRGVRRTARRLGMHTESSHRFERGTDPEATELVLARARALFSDLAGGVPAQGTVRADGPATEVSRIGLRSERLESLLGVHVPVKEATRVLNRLGFRVEFVRDLPGGTAECLIRGASFRPDVASEHDLIDEVARIRGLDAIPTVIPAIAPQEPRTAGDLERCASNIACELGLSEAVTYSFVSAQELEGVKAPAPVVRLSNPLSEERSVLRTSLAPGLLDALRRARRRGEPRVQLFTVGSLFLAVDSEQPVSAARPRRPEDEGQLPYEQPTLAAVLAGTRDEYLELKPGEMDVYDAKGWALEFVERMTRRRATVEHAKGMPHTQHLHPRGAARVLVEGTEVGTFGPLHPDVVDHFDLDGSAQLIEFNLALIEALGMVTPRYRPIPKLPAVTRDLSLVVPDETPAGDVASAVYSAGGQLCESVNVVTEFRGGSVPEGHRSLTFRVVFRDPDAARNPEAARTLTDKEVDALQEKAVKKASQDLGASLRG